jgi:hypothetical protein
VNQKRPLSAAEGLYQRRMRKLRRELVMSRLVRAVRKRGNVISIIAVTFALTSSAFKEHYSEQFKDASSAFERATDKVDLLSQFEGLRDEALTPVKLTWADYNDPDLFEHTRQTILDNIAKYKKKIEFDFQRLDLLKTFVQLTKFGEQQYSEASHRRTDLLTIYENFKFERVPDLLRKLGKLENDFQSLHNSLIRFTNQIREGLDQNTKYARRRKEIATQLSFIVFPVGIILAILGQIAKVKTGGDE